MEVLHGVEVADPHRWLEDDDDPEAAAVSFNINVFPRPGALGEDQS